MIKTIFLTLTIFCSCCAVEITHIADFTSAIHRAIYIDKNIDQLYRLFANCDKDVAYNSLVKTVGKEKAEELKSSIPGRILQQKAEIQSFYNDCHKLFAGNAPDLTATAPIFFYNSDKSLTLRSIKIYLSYGVPPNRSMREIYIGECQLKNNSLWSLYSPKILLDK